MQDYYFALSDALTSRLQGAEVFTATFSGEDSDFVRWNQAKVRQAGHVSQRRMAFDLIDAGRHTAASLQLTGDRTLDVERLQALLPKLREVLAYTEPDPFLLYNTEVASSESVRRSTLPSTEQVLTDIEAAAGARDLVGLYAAGSTYAGFANSLGQRNWHESSSYNFSWSFYHRADKAVQSSYAGFAWDGSQLARKAERAAEQLAALERTPRTIEPGRYRVYLAPQAMAELMMMVQRGFGMRAHRTRVTPLIGMVQDGINMHPSVNMAEHTAEGVAPDFQDRGFRRPPRVNLIEGGSYAQSLVSPRSSVEYGVPGNGASGLEMPASFELGAGDLDADTVLGELGRGIYIGNLHYLSYSDRRACRTTGLTRFATFWVEDGVIQAPLNVMRFDETIYRIMGENLRGLTRQREMILNPSTYGGRSSSSAHLPGALVEDFTLTL